jgi:hypothetical protein
VSLPLLISWSYLTSFLVESPVTKWPAIFENLPIFVTYPYLLPCAVAALVTFTGGLGNSISSVI